MDELDLFRNFCPDPGDPPAGHREAVERAVRDDARSRVGADRSGPRLGALAVAVGVVVAVVLAGVIVVRQARPPQPTDAAALGATEVRLDDGLAFVSAGGWDARRVRERIQRSDGTDEAVDALQIANFVLPPWTEGDDVWSTLYPSLHGDQAVITVLRVGAMPPDTPISGVITHQHLPIRMTSAELPANVYGEVEGYARVWLEHRGISYRIDVAVESEPADAPAIVNRALAGLRAVDADPSVTRLDDNVEYVAPSGWNARRIRWPLQGENSAGALGDDGRFTLQIGNYVLPRPVPNDSVGSALMEALTGDQVYINVFVLGSTPRNRRGDASLRTDLPVQLVAADFGGYSGMIQQTHARVSLDFRGTSYLIDVESKRDVAYAMAEANRALAGFQAIEPDSRKP